ncbi:MULTISPECIES: AAA family ATPase [unclassified Bradyrhizobium]|uniref:AAA family ATPase n=1 Tax=unclassified Bradyrhizobium TaxID=2631580 RepID=UPI0028EA1B2A|nr:MULTISPECIES: AAA family ATPase [unclassified Bradyrhizobium]
MSILKIDHIGSVGRFKSYSARGDVTFKKYTLIFGENGRGKTTFCSILRSLQLNEPAYIVGRKTLGYDKPPAVVITLSGGTARFKDGVWSNHESGIRIFDERYITENVYFGDSIATEQRRNLCRLMLGEEGISYRKAYEEADEAIESINGALRTLRQTLEAQNAVNDIEEFLSLQPEPDLEAKIASVQKQVAGFRDVATLGFRGGFETIEMPVLPSRLEQMLGRTFESISQEADRQVREHLAAHQMEGDQDWIARGMPHLRDACPFCGQSIRGINLIEAYRDYFNTAYMQFREELQHYIGLPQKYYADASIELLLSKLENNRKTLAIWRRYLDIPHLDESGVLPIREVVVNFRDQMIALLKEKSANPLVATVLTQSFLDAHSSMHKLAEAIATYNHNLMIANQLIAGFRRAVTSREEYLAAEEELHRLELIRARYSEPLKTTADEFERNTLDKKQHEAAKAQARSSLESYSSAVVARHLRVINAHLDNFNAGFSIAELKVEYTGREPNSTFCAVINGKTVNMGSSKTPLDQPSLKNTLSGGDRSALALAFFLAQIAEEADGENLIVIFDDPFSSQDKNRRTYTINEIVRCGDHVGQVIVLSHDGSFLREMWDKPLPDSQRKALGLCACGMEDTLLCEWDIEKDFDGEDAANKRALAQFYQHATGDPRDIVKRIRPVVETHMVRVVPELAKKKSLGDKLAALRDANGAPANLLLQHYSRIDDINAFTRKYMHGEGRNPEAEQLSVAELRGFVKKTLELTGTL